MRPGVPDLLQTIGAATLGVLVVLQVWTISKIYELRGWVCRLNAKVESDTPAPAPGDD